MEIPYDSSFVMQSIQSGKPLLTLTPKSKASLSISTLAYRLSSSAIENQAKQPSSFLKMVRKLVA